MRKATWKKNAGTWRTCKLPRDSIQGQDSYGEMWSIKVYQCICAAPNYFLLKSGLQHSRWKLSFKLSFLKLGQYSQQVQAVWGRQAELLVDGLGSWVGGGLFDQHQHSALIWEPRLPNPFQAETCQDFEPTDILPSQQCVCHTQDYIHDRLSGYQLSFQITMATSLFSYLKLR